MGTSTEVKQVRKVEWKHGAFFHVSIHFVDHNLKASTA